MSRDWPPDGRLHPPDDVIVDSIALPLIVLDEHCRIARFNTAAERLTGCFRSNVLGLACHFVINPLPCNASCPVQRVLRSGARCQRETMTIRTADALVVTVEAIAAPVFGPQGRVIAVVELLRQVADAGAEDAARESHGRRPSLAAAADADAIRDVLARTSGNLGEAARLLGVHRTTLWRRLRRLGITP